MENKIGQRIKERREQMNISQTVFGREVMRFYGSDNAVQKKVSKIESNQRKLTVTELYNISQYLCKPMEYFIIDQSGEEINNDFMAGWDEKSRAACMKLKEILDSNDKYAVPAILSNIDAFRDSVNKNDRLERLENAVDELKNSNAALSSEECKDHEHCGEKKAM